MTVWRLLGPTWRIVPLQLARSSPSSGRSSTWQRPALQDWRTGSRSLPKSVHIVPVIICVDDGGSLPIARPTFALSSEHATRMASAATCRGSRHSGVRSSTCAPTQHPGPPRGRRSSDSVLGPRSIRGSWPNSGRSLLAPTSPIEYWRSSSRARDRGRRPQPVDADADATDSLERARWYRSIGATQRCGEYLSNELADNTTSRFLK